MMFQILVADRLQILYLQHHIVKAMKYFRVGYEIHSLWMRAFLNVETHIQGWKLKFLHKETRVSRKETRVSKRLKLKFLTMETPRNLWL